MIVSPGSRGGVCVHLILLTFLLLYCVHVKTLQKNLGVALKSVYISQNPRWRPNWPPFLLEIVFGA